MTVQCAWCKRIQIRGAWTCGSARGMVSHHICPGCIAGVRRNLKRNFRAQRHLLPALADYC